MSKEHEPPEAPHPPQNRDNPENPTPLQRRKAEESAQKERQGLMEYSEKDEEKLLQQLEKFVIEGEKDEYFPYIIEINNFLDWHGIKNPFPLFRKLLERLTAEQALVLSDGIDASQDNEYCAKLREKIKFGVNPEAILRHSSYALRRYLSSEETGKIVKKAIFALQTHYPNGDRIIYKYLDRLTEIMPEAELQTLAKETLEKIVNSGKPEQVLEKTDETHFSISGKMDKLILQYTKKAVAMLVSDGKEEEVFNYARNYQTSFRFARMVPMRRIFGPVIIEVLKNPTEKIYKALLSAPTYYADLSFMDRTKFENVLYDVALEAAKDRKYMAVLAYNQNTLGSFLGDKIEEIWAECKETDPELFRELDLPILF